MTRERELRILNVSVCATFVSVAIASTLICLTRPISAMTVPTIAALLASLLLIRAAARRGQVRTAAWLFCALLWSVITVTVVFHGGLGTPVAAGYVVVILLASLLLGSTQSTIFGAASLFATVVVAVVETRGALPADKFLDSPAAAFATLAALFICASMVIHFYERSIFRALGVTLERQALLESEVERRKSSERALRKSEELLRSVTESAPDYIIQLDTEGRIQFINRTVPDLSVEEVTGRPIYDFVSSRFHEDMKACFGRVLDTGRHDHYRVEYEAASGETLVFESRVAPVEVEGGVIGLTVVSSDVTAVERATTEAMRLASLVEHSADFIGIADLDGKLTYINAAGLRMVGLASLSDVPSGRMTDFLVGLDASEPAKPLLQFPSTDGSWRGECRFRNLASGDSVPVEMNSFVVRDSESGAPLSIATVARDVTERKGAAAALARSEQQLRHAQKMEAIGLLAGGLAHDFNNILTVVSGYTAMVVGDGRISSEDREKLELVAAAADNASSLTQQLLAFSSRQVIQPQVLNIGVLLEETQRMLGRLIGEDIELEASLSGALGSVRADSGQVEQIIVNLVLNARDAMPNGGRLKMEARAVNSRQGHRDHESLPDGEYVRIEIADTGEGMDEETLSHIFEPFFTTKQLGNGTGLGLSTVYGIIKQMQGYIHVTSQPGKGSTFRVYLPVVDEVPVEPRPSPPPARGGTETVLVVEDDEGVRKLAERVLSSRGYEVLVAEDGPRALDVIADFSGTIDLLMTDVVMPGMNGQELAATVAEREPALKVLFMSGYSDTLISNRGIVRENTSLLHKPFTPAKLVSKVREVLDGTLCPAT